MEVAGIGARGRRYCSFALGPAKGKRWQPPEGLAPADVRAIIAAGNDRDRLLLRACDIRRDTLVLPNRKNPSLPVNTVFLAAGDTDLPGEHLLWQKQQHLQDDDPLFCPRKKGPDGGKKAISRIQAWKIVKEASARAGMQVQTLRPSQHGAVAAPATPACGSSCGRRKACRWPRSRRGGVGSRWPP